jgi:hypothetical protein
MSSYHFLCPRCGHGFLEGTTFTECPECQVPLLEAGASFTADLRELPEHLDLAALVREALAEQQPQEDVDAAVKRTVERRYPESAGGLNHLIGELLATAQGLRGQTRQEAAEEMAKSQSELQLGPDGTPGVRTILPVVRSEFHLEGLSAQQRGEVQEQIEALLKSGKPITEARIILRNNKSKAGCFSLMLIGVLVLVSVIALQG